MRLHLLPFFAVALITPCLSSGAEATGTLRGVVYDVSGGVVPNAIVIIQDLTQVKNAAGRVKYRVAEGLITDGGGEFTSHLTPGRYDIFVTHRSLIPFAKRVKVEPNKVVTLDCELGFDPQTIPIE